MPTLRQRHGALAEDAAASYLEGLGWRLIERNVKVGRDEIDIVAMDHGPPPMLVCVEVRSATSPDFGTPEERIGRLKVSHLYRAMRGYRLEGVRGLPRRVDLVVVDYRSGSAVVRHLRSIELA
jgi:putative endonuclease